MRRPLFSRRHLGLGEFGSKHLTFNFNPTEAQSLLTTLQGRAFVWYVLLHETHHIRTWQEQSENLDNVVRESLEAEASQRGHPMRYHVQCLGPHTALIIAQSDGPKALKNDLDKLGQRMYPLIAEADLAIEECLADIWAVKQWETIFGEPVSPLIGKQLDAPPQTHSGCSAPSEN
jgi:hypothetical protein